MSYLFLRISQVSTEPRDIYSWNHIIDLSDSLPPVRSWNFIYEIAILFKENIYQSLNYKMSRPTVCIGPILY